MFLQIQSELKIPNHFEEEYKTQVAALERKIEKLDKGNTDEFNALKLENEKKNGVTEKLKNDAEKKKEAYERSHCKSIGIFIAVYKKEDLYAFYKLCRELEQENKDVLVGFQEEYPGVLNGDIRPNYRIHCTNKL